jgi:hypothetical protein
MNTEPELSIFIHDKRYTVSMQGYSAAPEVKDKK